jgi:hypothetical protein
MQKAAACKHIYTMKGILSWGLSVKRNMVKTWLNTEDAGGSIFVGEWYCRGEGAGGGGIL